MLDERNRTGNLILLDRRLQNGVNRGKIRSARLLLAGTPVHFNGAGGGLNFEPGGRVTSTAYDIWQVGADGSAAIQRTIVFNG